MNDNIFKILLLRGLATVFLLQGKPNEAAAISALISAYETGRNVDNYMQEIADLLNGDGELASWDDITGRINAEVDELLSRESGGEPE